MRSFCTRFYPILFTQTSRVFRKTLNSQKYKFTSKLRTKTTGSITRIRVFLFTSMGFGHITAYMVHIHTYSYVRFIVLECFLITRNSSGKWQVEVAAEQSLSLQPKRNRCEWATSLEFRAFPF